MEKSLNDIGIEITLKHDHTEKRYLLAQALSNPNFNNSELINKAMADFEMKKELVFNNLKTIVERRQLKDYKDIIISQLHLFSDEQLNLILSTPEYCPTPIILKIMNHFAKDINSEKVGQIFSNLSDDKRLELLMLMLCDEN